VHVGYEQAKEKKQSKKQQPMPAEIPRGHRCLSARPTAIFKTISSN
jgi:hypothetical protein